MDKCVIFDLDCTITKRHLNFFLNDTSDFEFLNTDNITNSLQNIQQYFFNIKCGSCALDKSNQLFSDFVELIFGGYSRLNMLQNFFQKLAKTANIYIVSESCLTNLVLSMQMVGLSEYVYGYFSLHDNKYIVQNITYLTNQITLVDFIENIIIKQLQYNLVIYIDDDYSTHLTIRKNYIPEIKTKYNLIQNMHGARYIFLTTLSKSTNGISESDIMIINDLINS
jgi:hypothetical protein